MTSSMRPRSWRRSPIWRHCASPERNAGRTVPGDVGVVGFDDSSWAVRARPALSTVRQPAGQLGARAAELVLEQVRTGSLASNGALLATEIVWRDSA